MKIHFIGLGLIFLISLYILASNASKKWILYLSAFYAILQFFLDKANFKDWIDFFFGPFVILIMLDLLVNEKLPRALLMKYEKRFYQLLWVPIGIGVLQFFEILPLTFWNATYINSTKIGNVYIPRPNGFLYHGSELSIIICFVTLFQYFRKEANSFWTLLFMIAASIATYYKAIVICTLLLFFYYLAFVNKGPLSTYRLISKKRIIWYGGLIAILISTFLFQYFSKVYEYTGFLFPPQMLTGRGGIWNIYLEGVKDFNWWNYLFGSGMGSGQEIFREYASSETFYPLRIKKKLEVVYNSHNAILSIFVNAGIIGIGLFILLFKIIFNQIAQWKPDPKWNKTVYVAVFIIPLFSIGITIIIYEMAIIWPCIGFLLYRWKNYTDSLKTD